MYYIEAVDVVNLTAHDLSIFDNMESTNPIAVVSPSGEICRVVETTSIDNKVVSIGGCAVELGGKKFKKEVIGLPEKKKGVIYFVSAAAAKVAWAAGRNDVVCPLKAHRGEDGRTDGTVGLAENPALHEEWEE